MDRTEFEIKLLSLGGDLDRWPPPEAEAAKHLLANDPESRALLSQILAVDSAVRAAVEAPVEAALVGRIMAATRAPASGGELFGGWRRAVPAGALVVLLVASIGFKSGYDGGLGFAEELDLAAVVAGAAYNLDDMP